MSWKLNSSWGCNHFFVILTIKEVVHAKPYPLWCCSFIPLTKKNVLTWCFFKNHIYNSLLNISRSSMPVEWGTGAIMQPSPIQSRGSHCKGKSFARWGSNQLNCFCCSACTRSMRRTRCNAFHPSSPMALFFRGSVGGLSILGVEHSVCSCSLQMSPHEPFFLSRPFDTLDFSCTLRPVFSSYRFNPCSAFFS